MSLEKAVKAAQQRIRLLHKMLCDSSDSEEKTLARFCCETGVSKFTARRYLALLVEAGLVEEVEEKG